MPKKILFSFKKVEKHTILAGLGGGGQLSAPLALLSDAHGNTSHGTLVCHGLSVGIGASRLKV